MDVAGTDAQELQEHAPGSGQQGGPPVEPPARSPEPRAPPPEHGPCSLPWEEGPGAGIVDGGLEGLAGGSGRPQGPWPLRTGLGLGSWVTCLELGTPPCEVLLSSPSALGRVFHHFMMQSFWFSYLFKVTVT